MIEEIIEPYGNKTYTKEEVIAISQEYAKKMCGLQRLQCAENAKILHYEVDINTYIQASQETKDFIAQNNLILSTKRSVLDNYAMTNNK